MRRLSFYWLCIMLVSIALIQNKPEKYAGQNESAQKHKN